MISKLYRLLEAPRIHDAVQKFLAFGRPDFMSAAIGTLARPSTDQALLDLGCGTGRYAHLFDCLYVGFDLNFSYLEHAVKSKNGSGKRHHYVNGGVDASCFKPASFDYVLSVGVLHHLTDLQAGQTLSLMKKLVKPQGKAILFEPIYPESPLNALGRLIFFLDRGRHQRTGKRLDELTAAHGFRQTPFQVSTRVSFPHQLRIYEYASTV